MPIPLTPLQPLLLLQEDECAPDAQESFLANFPLHSGGLSLEEFKGKARREVFDDGFAICWYLDQLILSISADYPFYSLHKASPLNTHMSEGGFDA
jgi:hypothetical protein